MTAKNPRSQLETHDVLNQPAARGDADLWADDPVLRHYASSAGAISDDLAAFGADIGREERQSQGRLANRHPPELEQFDRAGRRIDEVRFHPSYHALLETGIKAGYCALPWEGATGGHATHAAMVYMMQQTEPGVCCPMTMTYAAVPALQSNPAIEAEWRPKLLSRSYDQRSQPLATKTGGTLGMAMTEKQGGSDLRANTTVAVRDGDGHRLRGHKWFCSAPMCDGFLTLAQTEKGLTCFLVPRWTPDGERNAIRLMRLKDKLGNRANASAEIEYDDAFAWPMGDEGDGVRTIIDMVHHTRLDTAIAPAGLMRGALAEVKWWVEGRSAFQRRLIDQPLMRAVLSDLVLDWEGATALSLFVAGSFDGTSREDRAFGRIAVALTKFLSNKRCPTVIYEAMECLGGMGFVEDTPLPLLYREAPLNSIWEGSGNIICLDVMRAMTKEPHAVAALQAELDAALGIDPRYDSCLADHRARWPKLPEEAELRWFVERLAVLLTASVLLRAAPNAVADGYVTSRVAGDHGMVSGTVRGLDVEGLLARLG